MLCKCAKCKNRIAKDDFICPHCGTIIGDPISYAISESPVKETKRSKTVQRIFSVLLAAGLIALLFGICLFVRALIQQHDTDAPFSTTSSAIPTPHPSTAPLAVYSVCVQAISKTDLTGTVVNICHDGQTIYSGEIDKDGNVSFVLPQLDGYSVMLTELPVQYQVNYDGVHFSFAEGEQSLQIMVEDQPVPFTVRVMNSAGEPLAGVGITFYSSGQSEEEQVTDETGSCVFIADYTQLGHSANISFVPNGYFFKSSNVGFAPNSLEAVVCLYTPEELGIDPDFVYTVRLVDEYGEPVTQQYLTVYGESLVSDQRVQYSGKTNLEGCYSFEGQASIQYSAALRGLVDYYGIQFCFEDGSSELLIQLDLNNDPGTLYTYTVSFTDFSGEPIPGVEIGVPSWFDDSVVDFYTSDENGFVRFKTMEPEPKNVSFYIVSEPDGYFIDYKTVYTFTAFERSLHIQWVHDGNVRYTVYVVDDAGLPVVNLELMLMKDGSYDGSVFTDEQGMTSFRYAPDWECAFALYPYDEKYKDYVIDKISYGEGRTIYITIAPSSDVDT